MNNPIFSKYSPMRKTLDERHAVFYAAFIGADQWRIKMKNEFKEISTKNSKKFKYLKYYCYNK